jgi:hypothetical protein
MPDAVIPPTPRELAPSRLGKPSEKAVVARTADIRAELFRLGCTFSYLLAARTSAKTQRKSRSHTHSHAAADDPTHVISCPEHPHRLSRR